MILQRFIWTVFLALMLVSISSSGQVKTNFPDDSVPKPSISKGNPKVVKNHFIGQYPQSYWFVQCGLQDKAGNLWFGTNADGVYCFDGKKFTNFTTKDGLCHNDVLCILEDNTGNIWFGTRGGLCRYKPSAGLEIRKRFSSFPVYVNTNSHSNQNESAYVGTFENNFVWSMLQDKSGKIWLGTNEGVYLFNPLPDANSDSPVFTYFLNNKNIVNKNKLHLKVIQRIIEDKHGNIWLASGDIEGEGICCYNGKSLINFKPEGVNSFRSIVASKNGDLLFLSQNHGVYRFDGKIFTHFSEKIGIKNDNITAMLEDKKGNLWFGTDSDNFEKDGNDGAWFYDGSSIKLFSTKDGLSHNSVFCIVEDRDGNIWIGTRNTDLCRFDGKKFTDFTE